MPLSTLDRARTVAQWMRQNTEPCSFNKAAVTAALAAADTWVDDNQTSYNQALPPAFRNNATTAQKVALLGFVLWRRIGLLRADED
jgi:hypothetical protein